MSQVVFAGQAGCLLPLLIMLNLLFGRTIFKSTYLWLAVEAALILIFVVKIHFFVQKITQQFRPGSGGSVRSGRVVDVEGEVVEDKKKIK